MRIACIISRYGLDINGGAELHCRLIAEELANNHQVHVLTTCAKNFSTWENFYPEERQVINKVKVIRFKTDSIRPNNFFRTHYDFLVSLHLLQNGTDINSHDPRHVKMLLQKNSKLAHEYTTASKEEFSQLISLGEKFWMRSQGPLCTKLLKYLETNKENYDVFFFFSYHYYICFYGLPIVKHKSVLIPTMHEDACAGFQIFKDFFKLPRVFFFNTHEEQNFALQQHPGIASIPQEVVGLGIKPKKTTPLLLKKRRPFYGKFIIYLGRVVEAKGLNELFTFFLEFKKDWPEPLKLLLAGEVLMEVPEHPDIRCLNYISENEKSFWLGKATAFVMPSAYESLSIALLEAWNYQIPALVNGNCQVLAGHCERSGAGYTYKNQAEFSQNLSLLLKEKDRRKQLGAAGLSYVQNNYSWERVKKCYSNVIESANTW